MRNVALSILVCTAIACSGRSGGDPGIAEAATVASRDGAPAIERIASTLGADRAAALASATASIAPEFVLPIIDERVAALASALTEVARAPALEGATIVAVSSDGAVFTSAGSIATTPFSRPFSNVGCVTQALSAGRTGRCFDRLLGLRIDYEIHVEPVRVGGAVVGALVALETRESIAGRVRDRVRAVKPSLSTAGICLGFGADEVCVDVPEEARRAATDAASRQPRPPRRSAQSAAIGGALVAIDLANWPSSALIFVHKSPASSSPAH